MMMMARRMMSSSRSLLGVQSLREFVSGDIDRHELWPPTYGHLSARISVSVTAFACCKSNSFARALRQSSAPRSLFVKEHGRNWGRAVRVSEFSTDAAPDVTPQDVLHFWFKDVDIAKNEFPTRFWFMGGEEFDKEVRERFGDCLGLASQGKLDHWKLTPRGRVALVLVLDQFPRNCYRDSSRSFAQDQAALQITLDSIEQGLDLQLSDPLERCFLYMPLMHSEAPDVHVEALRLFQKLADEHKENPELHETLQGFVKAEKGHSAILNKFGRYPSRNALLGRKSTPDEEVYLASGVTWPTVED